MRVEAAETVSNAMLRRAERYQCTADPRHDAADQPWDALGPESPPFDFDFV